MTNHYKFKCPITQGEEFLEHCVEKHGKMMQGKHAEIIPDICAVAHGCFMCPMRSAFRVGGPWQKPDSRPFWESPKENAAKLPKEILEHAIYHTLPSDMIYRKAGITEGQIYNEFLRSLQESGSYSVPRAEVKTKTPRKMAGAKKRPVVSAIDEIETDQMAQAVTDAVRASERPESTRKTKTAPKTQKKPKTPTESAESGSGKKLTLAERARLMREKKAAEKRAS